MARRKRKKNKTSWIGALIIEALAVVAFIALFVQARAQRQQEMTGETPTSAVAAWPTLLEETPFEGVLGGNNMNQQPVQRPSQNAIYNPETFLSRFVDIDWSRRSGIRT